MINFNSNEIEKKWQNYWKENDINKTNNDFSNNKKKFYILDMFPYPSGEGLHVGHPKGYIATDIYSRMKKMQGYNVLHPMGFDAFGLPAEQFAIKNKINPKIAVEKNIARYKEQLNILGLNYDWGREVNTTDPKFYKWTEWMWKQMYKDGLAYESFDPINWCPSCKTGLANEDLDGNTCERCGTIVEKKKLKQWTIRITDYADRLLNDLDKLDWEPHIKELQRNWIGKSEGSEIDFEIKVEGNISSESFKFRPELVSLIKEGKKNITFRIGDKKNISVGDIVSLVDWADGKKENQNEFTKAKIIKISEFKLGDLPLDYPGHEKDNSIEERLARYKEYYGDSVTNDSIVYVYKFQPLFLKIFTTRADTLFGCTFMAISYTLAKEWIDNGWNATPDIKNFIAKLEQEEKERTIDFDMSKLEKEGVDTGIKAINPANGEEVPIYIANYILSDYGTGAIMAVPAHDERDYQFAKKYNLEIREIEVIDKEEERKRITKKVGGKIVSKYKLKDWVFARQRYWGELFPIVFDENRKSYAVADKELPVILPDVENYEPTDTGESPLANIKDWVEVYGFINDDGEFESLEKNNPKAKLFFRETNTMPQWAGSSWYYLRYIDTKNENEFVNKELEKIWSPVDFYVGGAEHATRHLIYARFWHKYLFDKGYVNYDEPFSKLQTVGLIMAEDGKKMSKRYGNVVNPDDIIREYGADTLRTYEMFMGPFEKAINWNTDSIIGVYRFLGRVYNLIEKIELEKEIEDNKEIERVINETIKKVGEDIEEFKFNTAIAQMMICLNSFEEETKKGNKISKKTFSDFIQILSPFAIHICEEIWQNVLGNNFSVHLSNWPKVDVTKITKEEIEMSLQINGKFRGNFIIKMNINDEELKENIKELEIYKKYITDINQIKKIIIVKNKLINIVI